MLISIQANVYKPAAKSSALDLLKRLLQKKFEIVAVSNSSDLDTDLNQYEPDGIIIDHFIGCKPSKEVIDAFKKHKNVKNIPVIIHSGHEQIEQVAMASNACVLLKKPAGINKIRAYIEDQLAYATGEPAVSGDGL